MREVRLPPRDRRAGRWCWPWCVRGRAPRFYAQMIRRPGFTGVFRPARARRRGARLFRLGRFILPRHYRRPWSEPAVHFGSWPGDRWRSGLFWQALASAGFATAADGPAINLAPNRGAYI